MKIIIFAFLVLGVTSCNSTKVESFPNQEKLIAFEVVKESQKGLQGIKFVVCSGGCSNKKDFSLKKEVNERIDVWLRPELCDPSGSLYNLIQSKMAIGSGGLKGKGFLQGEMTNLRYVPEQSTDFIFSTIGEEQGFIGSFGVIILFTLLVYRAILIGERSRLEFIRNYAYGVAGIIFIHFFD